MLQIMRDMTKSLIFKTLMVLLIVSFGVWGIGDMFRGNPQQRAVAKVGKAEIPVIVLEQRFKLDMPEARQTFGPELTETQARQLGVLERTLSLLIEHALFNHETKRLGLNVSDQVIMKRIASIPQFRDKDGKFNAQLWRQALGRGSISERFFLDSEREDTARKLILMAIQNNINTPQAMLDNLYQARGSKRILEVLTLRNDSLKDIPAPEESKLKEFYEANGAAFTAPEYRGLTIVKLASEDLIKEINVSDDELKKAYESRKGDMALPEQRDLSQVIVQDEATAKGLAEAANETKDLEKAAKAKKLDIIALDRMNEKSTLPELYTTIFALEEGQISTPVKSALGWHVLQLKKIHPPVEKSFDEVKNSLRDTLQKEKAADEISREINKLDDALAGGRSLEDIADDMRLRLIKIPSLDANAKTPEGKDPSELPSKEEVMRIAFSQNAGDTSQVIEDKAGNYIVARTDEVVASHVRPFETVKDKVLTVWRDDQKAKQAAVMAEDIAKALRDGKSTTIFATKPGVEVRLSKPISLLGEVDRDIPVEAFPSVIKMKKGDVITSSGLGKQFVLRLADIVAVDPAKPDSTRIKVADDLKEKLPYELIEEYSQFLRQRFPVRINQELLETMKKQGS